MVVNEARHRMLTTEVRSAVQSIDVWYFLLTVGNSPSHSLLTIETPLYYFCLCCYDLVSLSDIL